MRLGLLALPLVLAAACGDDDSDGGGNGSTAGQSQGGSAGKAGGSAGSTAKGGNGGRSAASGGDGPSAGDGGDGPSDGGDGPGAAGNGPGSGGDGPGMGGGGSGSGGEMVGGAGGADAGQGGGGAGGGGGLDPQSTACDDFPATVTMGETFVVDQVGAILCVSLTGDACRLTTNTYSDGVNPCPAEENLLGLYGDVSDGAYRVSAGFPGTLDAEIVSISSGTIDETFPYHATDIAEGTPVTAVIEVEGRTFEVVFEFNDAELTLTSVEETT